MALVHWSWNKRPSKFVIQALPLSHTNQLKLHEQKAADRKEEKGRGNHIKLGLGSIQGPLSHSVRHFNDSPCHDGFYLKISKVFMATTQSGKVHNFFLECQKGQKEINAGQGGGLFELSLEGLSIYSFKGGSPPHYCNLHVVAYCVYTQTCCAHPLQKFQPKDSVVNWGFTAKYG